MTTLSSKSDIDVPHGRRFGAFAFFAWCILLTIFTYRVIGGYLFLIYTYGFSRVLGEHLYFVRMHKAQPWIVSNGDQIQGGGFLWWLMVTVIFFVLFIPTFRLIYRFLPKRKDKDAVNKTLQATAATPRS
jgi:hypothetical protein